MTTGDKVNPASGLDSRGQLSHKLNEALKAGPDHLGNQVRFILGLAQLLDQPAQSTSINDPLASVAEARLAAVAALKESLDQRNINTVLKDSQQIVHTELRLRIALNLATELDPEKRVPFIRGLWEQIRQLSDPGAKSRLLLDLLPLFAIKLEETIQVAQPLVAAIKLAQNMTNGEGRVRSLVALAVHLPGKMQAELFSKIFDDIDDFNSDQMRANAIAAAAENLPPFTEQRIMQSVHKIKSATERARALIALARASSASLQTTIRREVIKAITQIESEDDRAESLIKFAPHMEPANEAAGYTTMLEQALGVAITLSRRNLRARVLVALAPHLTLDLQGEALAAVHSLSNERDRALLLAELAPTLPGNMLVASLAVAHTMREKDARVLALTSLAHYAPEHARAQTIKDAMDAANALNHQYERVTALLSLADLLPPHLLDEAFENALDSVREIENESATSRALSQLGSYLPANMLNEALELIEQIENPLMRLNAFVGIAPRIDEELRNQALKRILETINTIPMEYRQARALVTCAPHLPPSLLLEAVALADQFEEAFDRVSSYIALAQNLPPDLRPDVVKKAWLLIDQIDEGYDRASALAAIAPYLPGDVSTIVAEKASKVINAISDEYDRASAITILAGQLARGEVLSNQFEFDQLRIAKEAFLSILKIPNQAVRSQHLRLAQPVWETLKTEDRYQLWAAIAPHIANLPLADCLLSLSILLPATAAFVSSEIQRDIALILGLR